jgi:hypothetical protein
MHPNRPEGAVTMEEMAAEEEQEQEVLQLLSGERDMLDDDDDAGEEEEEQQQQDDGAQSAAGASQQQGQQPQQGQGQQEHSTASTTHFYSFLADKAGMRGGVSKEEVARIVHEASVNSKYYKHQQRQDAVRRSMKSIDWLGCQPDCDSHTSTPTHSRILFSSGRHTPEAAAAHRGDPGQVPDALGGPAADVGAAGRQRPGRGRACTPRLRSGLLRGGFGRVLRRGGGARPAGPQGAYATV